MKRLMFAVLATMILAGTFGNWKGAPAAAAQEREMGLREHPTARDAVSPADLVDLDVNLQLYGTQYTITVGPYDRFSAEDVARGIMVNGLRYTSVSPPANYLYAPNIIRYIAFRTVP